MNPLRPPSSSSRHGRGRGASASVRDRAASIDGARTASIDGARAADGSSAAAASPPLPSLPAWWTSTSPMGSTEGVYPQGGFTTFLQSNGGSENFHLVGQRTSSTEMSPTAPNLKRTLPTESNAQDKETINVDDADRTNDEVERSEKRLNYTKDEDERLASAWLHKSKDPVDGTDRSGDQFWQDITDEYNESTEVSRRRNRNQLKIRWDRLKKPSMEFHGCWVSTSRVYRSGYSDDQLMDMAEKMYAKDHNGRDFQLKHFWNVVRDERKWSAYVTREKDKEKKGASRSPAEVVNLEGDPTSRPMGHKKARDELHGKKNKAQAYSVIGEKVDKFIEVTTLARKDREKMAETQKIMAHSKVEAARLNEIAAEKQLKCKMLDTFRELLLAPTDNMNAQALAERDKALESMRLALFGTNN